MKKSQPKPVLDTSDTLIHLDGLCRRYSEKRRRLRDALQAMEHELSVIRRRHTSTIQQLAQTSSELVENLRKEVAANPELFVRPRSMTLHGIQIGFAKGSGKIDWDDDDQVVERIEKLFPDRVDQLIRTVKKPSSAGLELLDAKELARLGARVEDTGDMVIVRSKDGEIDKAIKKIIQEGATQVDAGE